MSTQSRACSCSPSLALAEINRHMAGVLMQSVIAFGNEKE